MPKFKSFKGVLPDRVVNDGSHIIDAETGNIYQATHRNRFNKSGKHSQPFYQLVGKMHPLLLAAAIKRTIRKADMLCEWEAIEHRKGVLNIYC